MEISVVSDAELVAATAELLPTREALSWVNLTNITSVNIAIAINAASAGAVANATAWQSVAVG